MNDTVKREPIRRRQQQRSIDTRQKITNAALAQFAMLGFDGASTRGIAQAAEVPHSLVLHHYKGKEELWYEAVREVVDSYKDRIFEAPELDGKPPTEQIRHIFAQYIRFSAEFPDFFRMITQENLLKSERLRWLVDNHVGRVAAHLTGLIGQAQSTGAFVAGNPLELLYVFLGAATGPYRSATEIELISGRSPNDPGRVEEHIEICLALFLRDGKPQTRPSHKRGAAVGGD